MRNSLFSRKRFIALLSMGVTTLGMSPLKLFSRYQNKMTGKVDLGDTGLSVSPLCFGASRTQDTTLMRYALDQGINFIDTGRSYANGKNEELVGKVIREDRQRFIIQTKARLRDVELTGKNRVSDKKIEDILTRELEGSLQALKTDYVDILLMHGVDKNEQLTHPAVRKFFEKMKNRGMVRAAGFSAHRNQLQLLQTNNRDFFFRVVMVPFNPSGEFVHSRSGWHAAWDQQVIGKELARAREHGVGTLAMKTCSGGPHQPEKSNHASYHHAVKWVLERDFIDAAAVAMTSFTEIDDILGINTHY